MNELKKDTHKPAQPQRVTLKTIFNRMALTDLVTGHGTWRRKVWCVNISNAGLFRGVCRERGPVSGDYHSLVPDCKWPF